MRVLSEELSSKKFSNFSYCYEIITTNSTKLFLTSASNDIRLEDKLYKSSSALLLKEAVFNDSAHDYAILEGIFNDSAISRQLELTGAKVKISMLFPNHLFHLITYGCTVYSKYDLSFSLRLEPESRKYNQDLLKSYSKTCRADFCDNKCRLSKDFFSFEYKIIEISETNIQISEPVNKESGYFTDGTAILENFKTKILVHNENNIKISTRIPENLMHKKNILLIAGCDKKFSTCCNKFNNEINFRGEPFIPNDGFLKVS